MYLDGRGHTHVHNHNTEFFFFWNKHNTEYIAHVDYLYSSLGTTITFCNGIMSIRQVNVRWFLGCCLCIPTRQQVVVVLLLLQFVLSLSLMGFLMFFGVQLPTDLFDPIILPDWLLRRSRGQNDDPHVSLQRRLV